MKLKYLIKRFQVHLTPHCLTTNNKHLNKMKFFNCNSIIFVSFIIFVRF